MYAIGDATTGITLVALVVTIVVLLILAGITLVYVLGDNGIIKLAQEAKNKTEQGMQKEQDEIGNLVNVLKEEYGNSIGNGESTTEPETPEGPEEVPVERIKSDWVTLAKIAEKISKDSSIPNNASEATAVVEGKKYTIKVGDIFEVTYDPKGKNAVNKVRVLGFKHDTLVKNYDGTANTVVDTDPNSPKAGITFDFVYFMADANWPMNTNNSNANGWGSSDIRRDLNGYTKNSTTQLIEDEQSGEIGGEGAKLSNASQIKQVKKDYITTSTTGVQSKSQDYLWLLSCAEIVNTGYKEGTSGWATTREGTQYPYYAKVTTDENGKDIAWNTDNSALIKEDSTPTGAHYWWLRSPYFSTTNTFCYIYYDGKVMRYHRLREQLSWRGPRLCHLGKHALGACKKVPTIHFRRLTRGKRPEMARKQRRNGAKQYDRF